MSIDSVLLGLFAVFIVMGSIWLASYVFYRTRRKNDSGYTPFVSIILPAYNEEPHIKSVVENLLKIDYPKREIIAVDDGSADSTYETLCRFKDSITVIKHKKNKGKAGAVNSGIIKSKGEIIVTVDGDSFPESDSLRKLVRHFSDSSIGAVAGTVKISNMKNMFVSFQFIEYMQNGFQRLLQTLFNGVMVTPGSLSAYRKTALMEAGMFSSDTLVEDWDVSMKIHKAGYKIYAEKDAVVYTIAPEKIRIWMNQRIRWQRGGIQIFRKHSDIIFNKNYRGLGFFSFPVMMVWMVVPWVAIPVSIIKAAEGTGGLAMFAERLWEFFSSTFQWKIMDLSVSVLFSDAFQAVLNFFDLQNMNLLRILGISTVCIMFTFSALALREHREKLTPKNLLTIYFMSFYYMCNFCMFAVSLTKELLNFKRKW